MRVRVNQDTISFCLRGRKTSLTFLRAFFGTFLLCLSVPANATSISFGYNMEFSGATAPVGASPWLTATFDDENTPGTVKLTFAATNLTGSEFVSGAYFNVNTSYDPATTLSFGAPSKTGTFTDPTISLSTDAFKADGDGNYDVLLNFAMGGGASGRFGAGEAVEYLITGIGSAAGTLVATDFEYLSAPAGGHGPFFVAAHVQGIGESGSQSGWVTTPEPASWLLALGCAAIFGRRRR